jgi:hypothetical protein
LAQPFATVHLWLEMIKDSLKVVVVDAGHREEISVEQIQGYGSGLG